MEDACLPAGRENGKWKLEDGGWKMEGGRKKISVFANHHYFPIPFSIFYLLFSIYNYNLFFSDTLFTLSLLNLTKGKIGFILKRTAFNNSI